MNPSLGSRPARDNRRLELALETLEQRILLADWTFMVYMSGDNSLESAALNDFLEMAHVGSSADVNIVVQMDRTAGYDATYDNWTDARRGDVQNGDLPDTTWGSSIGEVNMGDGATLEGFVTWAINNYDADHYALIIWQNGQGWARVISDGTSGDYLTMDEIDDAVEGAIGATSATQMDLLCFDASMMGMLEVAHEFKDTAEVMVVSQASVDTDGLPYDDILADLVAMPGLEPDELGYVMAAHYYTFYAGSGVSTTVLDMNEIGALSSAVGDFGNAVISTSTAADRGYIESHRASAVTPEPAVPDFRDLGLFLQAVALDANVSAGLRNLAQAALDQLGDAVLTFFSDPNMGSGVSILFPDRAGVVDADYLSNLEFSADTEWDDFLSYWIGGLDSSWTVMVYMAADNYLGYFMYPDIDFAELSVAGSNADVSVVAQVDLPFFGALRGLVGQGDDLFSWGTPIGEVDMADPAVLSDFINWAIATYPAENFALFLWGPGEGWQGLLFDRDTGVSPPSGPVDLAVADLNDDGIDDLAVANRDENNVSILVYNSTFGLFELVRNVSVGDEPVAIAAGDFTGDGVADLVVATQGDGRITLLENNGSGSFSVLDSELVGNGPAGIALGDFDDDTFLDVAVTKTGDDSVTIFLCDGAGLGTATIVSVGSEPKGIVAADFDQDGYLDLAVVNSADDEVEFLENNGAGGFTSAGIIAVGNNPTGIAAADFDGDDFPDLAVTNTDDGDVEILMNPADNTFAFTSLGTFGVGTDPVGVTTGDFNDDGLADLAVTNSTGDDVSVLLNDGGISFLAAVQYGVGTTPLGIAAGDFDDDGNLDLATANSASDNVSLLLNNGAGSLADPDDVPVEDRPADVVQGDFDGDGDLDLAVVNRGSDSVSILEFNQVTNSYDIAAVNVAVGGRPVAIAVGQFNPGTDSDLDLVIVNSQDGTDRDVTFLFGDGAGNFGGATHITGIGVRPSAVFVADFDQDGLDDVAVATEGDDTVSILLNDGADNFAVDSSYDAGDGIGDGPVGLTGADFDNDLDGTIDLAVVNHGDDTVTLLFGLADGTFTVDPTSLGVGVGPTDIVTGDFDGDGEADLAVTNSGGGTDDVSVLLGDGLGGFGAPLTFSVGDEAVALATADVDGDANLDLLVVCDGADDSLVVLLNPAGDASFVVGRTYEVGQNPTAVTAADFNDDGNVDAAVTNDADGTVSVLLGNGPGAFADAANTTVGATGTDDNVMSVMELREALEDVPENIDVLGLQTGLMGMLEVAYEVRGEASYFVASENGTYYLPDPSVTDPFFLPLLMLEEGMVTPFDVIVSTLRAAPNTAPAVLADLVAMQSFAAFSPFGDQVSAWAAVDLSNVGALGAAVDLFADRVLNNGTLSDRALIDVHRAASYTPDYGFPTSYIQPETTVPQNRDLGAFMAGVAGDEMITQTIRDAAAQAVLASQAATISFYGAPEGPTGLTVYLPADLDEFDTDYHWSTLSFLDDTDWDRFLRFFLAGVTPVMTLQNGTAVVTVYDMIGAADIDASGVQVKFLGNAVKSITIKGGAMPGLGIVIKGATSVGSIKDARKGASGLSFIASSAPIAKMSIKSSIDGENLNGRLLGGILFAPDVDGDGNTFDATGLYVVGSVGSAQVGGSLYGDAWISGSLGQYKSKAGEILSDVTVGGSVGSMQCLGLGGRLSVGDDLGKLDISRGVIGSGSVIDVGDTIGEIRAAFLEAGYAGWGPNYNNYGQPVNSGTTIQAGTAIGRLRFGSVGVPTGEANMSYYLVVDEEAGEFIFTSGAWQSMANVLAPVIDRVDITYDAAGMRMLAGTDLGADYLPGGYGIYADTYRVGQIGTLNVGGTLRDSLVAAGISSVGIDYIGSGWNLVPLYQSHGFVNGSTIGDISIGTGFTALFSGDDAAAVWGSPSTLFDDDPENDQPMIEVDYGIGTYSLLGTITVRGGTAQAISTASPYRFRHSLIFVEDPVSPTWPIW